MVALSNSMATYKLAPNDGVMDRRNPYATCYGSVFHTSKFAGPTIDLIQSAWLETRV